MDWVKKQRFVKKNVTEEVAVKVNTTNASNASNSTEPAKEEAEESSSWSLFSSSKSTTDDKEKPINASNATNETTKVIFQNVTREKTVEIVEEKLEKKLHTVVLNLTRKHDGVPALSDEA